MTPVLNLGLGIFFFRPAIFFVQISAWVRNDFSLLGELINLEKKCGAPLA